VGASDTWTDVRRRLCPVGAHVEQVEQLQGDLLGVARTGLDPDDPWLENIQATLLASPASLRSG